MKNQLSKWITALAISLVFIAPTANALPPEIVPYYCNSVKSMQGHPVLSVVVFDVGAAYSQLYILGDAQIRMYETIRRMDSYHFFTKEASVIIQKDGRIVENAKLVPAEFRANKGGRLEMVCVEGFDLSVLRQPRE